jgi:hypothetical protein
MFEQGRSVRTPIVRLAKRESLNRTSFVWRWIAAPYGVAIAFPTEPSQDAAV